MPVAAIPRLPPPRAPDSGGRGGRAAPQVQETLILGIIRILSDRRCLAMQDPYYANSAERLDLGPRRLRLHLNQGRAAGYPLLIQTPWRDRWQSPPREFTLPLLRVISGSLTNGPAWSLARLVCDQCVTREERKPPNSGVLSALGGIRTPGRLIRSPLAAMTARALRCSRIPLTCGNASLEAAAMTAGAAPLWTVC